MQTCKQLGWPPAALGFGAAFFCFFSEASEGSDCQSIQKCKSLIARNVLTPTSPEEKLSVRVCLSMRACCIQYTHIYVYTYIIYVYVSVYVYIYIYICEHRWPQMCKCESLNAFMRIIEYLESTAPTSPQRFSASEELELFFLFFPMADPEIPRPGLPHLEPRINHSKV